MISAEQRFLDLFACSPSSYVVRRSVGHANGSGKVEAEYVTYRQKVPIIAVRAHLDGRECLGLKPALPNGTCTWAVLDHDHYAPETIALIREQILVNKLPLHLFPSKSGGLHDFIFFEQPQPIMEVRALLERFARIVGDEHCEIFPKVVAPGREGFGIAMPFFGEREAFDKFQPELYAGCLPEIPESAGSEELRKHGKPLPPGFEHAIAEKLNIRRRHDGAVIFLDYHGVRGKDGQPQPCLLAGRVHESHANEPRQSTFRIDGGTVCHWCFHVECRALAGSHTELAAARLGLACLWTETKTRPGPVILTSTQYLTRQFPAREPFVVIKTFRTPVFTARSINQVYGWRGTGKSMFLQALAGHLAVGKPFLNFEIPRPCRVLYVDGELPSTQIQERIRVLYPPEALLEILDIESQGVWGIPHLATLEGQQWLEPKLDGMDVLILDGMASLAPFSATDNELQTLWNRWLMRLRARGLCVIASHQAGKLGAQRLTSANDDPLDVQIKLNSEDEECGHLKCTLHYDKFRAGGPGTTDITVEFQNGHWTFSETLGDKFRLIEEYFSSHPRASAHKLAREYPQLGSLATVKRLVRRWKDEQC